MRTTPSQTPAQLPQASIPTPPAPPVPGQLQGPVVPTPVVATSIDALQAQIAELTGRIAGLTTESRIIRSQLRHPADAGARTQLLARYGEVNSQIAQSQSDLARVRAELATRQAIEQRQGAPNPFPRSSMPRPFDPDLAAGLMFAFIFAVLMPISIAYARRIWRGKSAPAPRPDDALSGQRMERLEQSMDAIAIEIERISEGQRFVTKVLAARQNAQPAPMPVEQPAPEAQSLRALGAGPMEPIRMPERQAVRQSITPH